MHEHSALGGGPVMFGEDFDRDPSAAYDFLREQAPAYRLELPGDTWTWLLTRHSDVVDALADPRLAKCPSKAAEHWRPANLGLPADHRPSLGTHMTNADGDDHIRLRKVCAGAFGSRRVHHVRQRTQNLANDLIDPLIEQGGGDLVEDFAYPLGITTICELIGIPDVLVERVRAAALIIAAGDSSDTPAILRATDTFDALFAEMIDLKRREPGTDLVSDLLAKVDTGELTDEEVASTAFLTLIAGYETTISLIASTALSLIDRPEDTGRARTDDAFLAAVVEEVLRRDTPIQNSTWRFVTEPMTLAGQAMEPGDPVLLSLLAANRDPDAFPDPLTFAPGARSTRHVAFGKGPHMCIGAGLARMQATTAIRVLLTRIDTMTLTVPETELQWWPSPITRGLHHLPVAFS